MRHGDRLILRVVSKKIDAHVLIFLPTIYKITFLYTCTNRMLTSLIVTLVLSISAYYWYIKYHRIDALSKKRTPKVKPKPIRQKSVHPDYRCVVIKPKMGACHSAEQLVELPILMQEATALPLKSCDAEKCDCRYERRDDRRMNRRRNNTHQVEQFMTNQNNRRQQLDRRNKPSVAHNLDEQTIMLV